MVMTYDAFGELISICQKNVLHVYGLRELGQNRQYSINNI